MYLVLIKTVKKQTDLGRDISHSPAIEKLQAFDYQLRTDKWSVLDCVPEKGGMFEVHYGSTAQSDFYNDENIEVMFSCVLLCTDAQSAICCAALALKVVENKASDHADFYQQMPKGCTMLYFRDDIRASKFFFKP